MPEYTKLFKLVDECSTHELEKLENAKGLTKDKQKRLNMLRIAQYNHEFQQLTRNKFDQHDEDVNKHLEDAFVDEFHEKHGWLPEAAQKAFDKRHAK